MALAMSHTSAAVTPRMEIWKRARNTGKSRCSPWALATMAKHARPHSAASVCSTSGTRWRRAGFHAGSRLMSTANRQRFKRPSKEGAALQEHVWRAMAAAEELGRLSLRQDRQAGTID